MEGGVVWSMESMKLISAEQCTMEVSDVCRGIGVLGE